MTGSGGGGTFVTHLSAGEILTPADTEALRRKWLRKVADSGGRLVSMPMSTYTPELGNYFGYSSQPTRDPEEIFWDQSWWTPAMIEVDRLRKDSNEG